MTDQKPATTPQQNPVTKTKDPVKYLAQFSEQMQGMVPETAQHFRYELLLDQLSHQMRNNPKLAKCTPESLGRAVKNCCLLGVLPGYGADTAEVYFIPYADQATTDVSYKGLETLMMRTGQFKRIRSEPLWEGDEFQHWDGSAGVEFTYKPCGKKETLIGAFAMAETVDNVRYIVHMPVEEIEELEKKTRKGSSQSPAWRQWFDRMARKTALKRLFRDMPRQGQHPLLSRALVIDAENAEVQAKANTPAAIAGRMS
jgi:recombination protein RecT